MNREMPNKSEFDTCLTAESAEVLFAYVDGTLEPARAASLARHAAACEPCRKLIEGQQAMWAVLDSWEPPEISPDFNRKMHAAVAAEAEQRSWRRWLGNLVNALTPHKLLVPAGVLALVLGTVVLTQMPRHNTVPAPDSAVEQKAGIESEQKQIERTLDDLDVLTTLDAALASEEKI